MTDDAQAFFAPPSLEGAQLALADLLVKDKPQVDVTRHCAVAIDVFNEEDILIQRALAHAEVAVPVRDAFRELVDRTITRFADAQDLDHMRPSGEGGPYRNSFVDSNDFSGFDCGYALAVARGRVAKLRAGLRSADELIVRLFAIPFLVATVKRRATKQAVILRKDDGSYVYEVVERADGEEDS